jgi:hypothetical protein
VAVDRLSVYAVSFKAATGVDSSTLFVLQASQWDPWPSSPFVGKLWRSNFRVRGITGGCGVPRTRNLPSSPPAQAPESRPNKQRSRGMGSGLNHSLGPIRSLGESKGYRCADLAGARVDSITQSPKSKAARRRFHRETVGSPEVLN